MGGCASNNKGKSSMPVQEKQPETQKQTSQVKKLTPEQAQKKRQQLRKNLEQGHAQPPPIHIPKIEPVGILS